MGCNGVDIYPWLVLRVSSDTPHATPLQLTFRHLDRSPAVEARVRELVEHLERFHDRITGCHVVIDAPSAHRSKGAPYDVKVDLSYPAAEYACAASEQNIQQTLTSMSRFATRSTQPSAPSRITLTNVHTGEISN
jgi:hypothetical protein